MAHGGNRGPFAAGPRIGASARTETCVIRSCSTLSQHSHPFRQVRPMPNRYSRAHFGAAIVVAFFCGLVFVLGFALTPFSWAQGRVGNATKPTTAEVASAAETETAFEAVADHARPAVV